MSNPGMNNDIAKDFAKALYDEKESREKLADEKKKKRSTMEFIVYTVIGSAIIIGGLYLLDILQAIANKF